VLLHPKTKEVEENIVDLEPNTNKPLNIPIVKFVLYYIRKGAVALTMQFFSEIKIKS
jgi:hypothetical protein